MRGSESRGKAPTKKEITAAVKAAKKLLKKRGGARRDSYSSSSESDDDMYGGGFTSALASIAARAAKAVGLASKGATKAATTGTKAATEVVETVATKAPSIASRLGSKALNAANLFGVAANVALPIYSVTEIVKQQKDEAAAKRAQEAAQLRFDEEQAIEKAKNDKLIQDARDAAIAEKNLYDSSRLQMEKDYAAAEAERIKQAAAFQSMMDMILGGQYNDVDMGPAPPVASGPTQEEIEKAIRDAKNLPSPPPTVPVYPTAPAPPPVYYTPAPAPPPKRRK